MKSIKEVIIGKLNDILENGTLFNNHEEEAVDINIIEIELYSYDLGIRMYDLSQDDLWFIIEEWAELEDINLDL